MQGPRSFAPERGLRGDWCSAAPHSRLGLVAALAPHMRRRCARRTCPPCGIDPVQADTGTAGAQGDRDADAGDSHAIVIEKGDKRIRIDGLGRDREYDSFQQFVQDAPWLAGLVFLFVLLVFLIPLLIIVLLIWYKIRKNRMANETMLKLAERGVVPPAAAMDAVASGTAASVAAAASRAADQSRLRACAIPAPAHRMVGFAQGHHPRRSRSRPHVLFDARRRHAEQHRSHPAVRRTRLLPAVVLRGPHERAASRHARLTAAGERVMPGDRTMQRSIGRHA